MTPNADLATLIADLKCLAMDPARLCRSGHRVLRPPMGMTTCPADFPTWDRHPCGSEFVDGWLVGAAEDDVPAILSAAIAALEALAHNEQFRDRP